MRVLVSNVCAMIDASFIATHAEQQFHSTAPRQPVGREDQVLACVPLQTDVHLMRAVLITPNCNGTSDDSEM